MNVTNYWDNKITLATFPASPGLFQQDAEIESIALPDGQLRFSSQFYSEPIADILFSTLLKETVWKQESIHIAGIQRQQPRLSAWYGDENATYAYSGLYLTPLAWTDALLQVKKTIELATQTSFNSVLLNLYRNEQDSMGWHADDETELGEMPCIASLSLGETRQFQLKRKLKRKPIGKLNSQTEANQSLKIALTHGSLLIMEGSTQTHWLHSIPKEKTSCQPRINLTFRKILR